MKKQLSLVFLLFFNFLCISAQTKSDFSFNMVKVADAASNAEAPKYGFITGTDKTNESFYFVMIYPKKMAPLPVVNIKYIIEGLEKEAMNSSRATLIPYDGIVIIGDYRVVVYHAPGRTSIRRKYVQKLNLSNRDNHRMYINRTTNEKGFVPDIFDPLVEMNARHFDEDKDVPLSFRLLRKIPDVISSGYPVVDVDGYLNGLIASPKGNEEFDVISMLTIKRKLSAMAEDGYACKYFGLVYKGFESNDCDDVIKKDSVLVAKELNKKRRIQAIKQNINYPFAVGLKAGASGQYTNVGGTVSPGYGYYGGIDIHILPDTALFGLSIRPRYGIYQYFPLYERVAESVIKRAERKQFDLQLMAELKFNRRLNGHNYIGFGYSRSFNEEANFHVRSTNGSSVRYNMPETKDHFKQYILEVGWDMGKVRYSLSGAYQGVPPFPKDYSITINNQILTPFADMTQHTLFLNFEIAIRLWGHWRNGIKG